MFYVTLLTKSRQRYFSAVYEFTKRSSKCMKYSAKFKLQVVKFAQESNNCAAGREFCINEKLVRDWQKQVKKLRCTPKNKCSNCGELCQYPKENFPPGVLVHCHPKGWMDNAGMKLSVEKVWRSSEKEKSSCLGLLPSSFC